MIEIHITEDRVSFAKRRSSCRTCALCKAKPKMSTYCARHQHGFAYVTPAAKIWLIFIVSSKLRAEAHVSLWRGLVNSDS